MSWTRTALLAVALGCGPPTDAHAGDKKPPGDDAPVKAIVAHFAANGVTLKPDDGNWWVVTDPKADGFSLRVALRGYPATATEKEMRDNVMATNLALMLNAPARVAMSHLGLRHDDPTKKAPKVADHPVAVKLEKLFKEYRPPGPKD